MNSLCSATALESDEQPLSATGADASLHVGSGDGSELPALLGVLVENLFESLARHLAADHLLAHFDDLVRVHSAPSIGKLGLILTHSLPGERLMGYRDGLRNLGGRSERQARTLLASSREGQLQPGVRRRPGERRRTEGTRRGYVHVDTEFDATWKPEANTDIVYPRTLVIHDRIGLTLGNSSVIR